MSQAHILGKKLREELTNNRDEAKEHIHQAEPKEVSRNLFKYLMYS